MLVDMSVPFDQSASVKVTEIVQIYASGMEKVKMWGMKTMTVAAVIWELGLIKKGIESQIDKIPRNINRTELQMIALLGSSHIL